MTTTHWVYVVLAAVGIPVVFALQLAFLKWWYDRKDRMEQRPDVRREPRDD